MPKVRCVNLDWLEVCCLEPTNSRNWQDNTLKRDADYFLRHGYHVDVREYGTPMYREMFTVFNGKEPLIEVRRSPYSCKSDGGIFEDNICHLRVVNKVLYTKRPVEFLTSFIRAHSYTYKNTTRIDFCCDFNTFDNRREVPNFIRDYMREKYFKMNQKYVHAHGVDSWPFRDYWSLKWGEETSPLTTKLYEKTKELAESSNKKAYIIDAWRDAGLDTSLPVYRVEFSIKGSQLKQMVQRSTGQLMELHYYEFPNRDTILFTFLALADRYFDFRECRLNRNGNPQRRDRCPRVTLFASSANQKGYSPIRFVEKPDPTRTDKMLVKRLFAIMEDDSHYTASDREKAQQIAALIMETANYKRRGIEMPNVREKLQLLAEQPTMSATQFREFTAKMLDGWNKYAAAKLEILKKRENPNYIPDDEMPF